MHCRAKRRRGRSPFRRGDRLGHEADTMEVAQPRARLRRELSCLRQTSGSGVPIEQGSEPYRSMPFERTVLVVARTATTTSWLLEVFSDVIAEGTRIQVVFTVEDKRRRLPPRRTRPARLHRRRRDAVVPSDFDPLRPRRHVLFQRQLGTLAESTADHPARTRHRKAGIRPPGRTRAPPPVAGGSATPAATVVLSHEEADPVFPDQADVELVVAGDPCLDRLYSSLQRRARYREAFGVTGLRADRRIDVDVGDVIPRSRRCRSSPSISSSRCPPTAGGYRW